ncbi:sterol O-acyltransferase 1-like [Ischnura elegans]|uniref:sterol O-acyltransferase 1-like n=1 Tax=Ischnura elegans TaxID=197161 RepID=UPI001ED88F35|nr:sterol O-acyltransferase 1-like [Ischnura elegans]XP_046383574.1 sterol O-acyltransferase 1-like [Ischnura elegans]XP_046383575.1 sterol O-acyltransferase 1-like [Ischnura elegans]
MGQKIKVEEICAATDTPVTGDSIKYTKSEPGEIYGDKLCLERNSLLTDIYYSKHGFSMSKMVVVFLMAYIIKEITLHMMGIQEFDLAFDLLLWNFGGLGTIIVYWLGIFSSTVAYYYAFYFWATERRKFQKLGKKQHLIEKWDSYFLLFMVVYMLTFLFGPCYFLMQKNLPVASTMIVLFEQVRFSMKKYAFSRTTIPKLMKNCGDEEFAKCFPDISHYTYFLFVPTLIYRSHYPRKSHIDWNVVIWNFTSFAAMMVIWATIFKHYISPKYQNFTPENMSLKVLASSIIHTTIPMLMLHLTSFYLLLHCWMNGFAELMHFPDRLFYKDWWACTDFSTFFRTWNVLVGDWLYVYIYQDVAALSAVKDKDTKKYRNRPMIPRMAVFTVSAFFHEYIIAGGLKFLYPIQFIMFAGIGGMMTSYVKTKGDFCNMMMIFSLGLGDAILFALYCNEWYARKVCPMQLDPVMDFITPRSWFC